MKFLDVPQSGSYAGVTHSRNRFGQYRRTRAIPVNPNSVAQGVRRGALADFSAAWRGLTDAERQGWNSLADEVSFTNSLGATIHLTGHQLFVRNNMTNFSQGGALIDTALPAPAFDVVGDLTILADVSTPIFSVEAADAVNTGQTFQIWASPQRSAGRNFEADYRLIDAPVSYAQINAGHDIKAAYEARLGALVAGNRIFLKVVQVEAGWSDNGTLASTVVVA